MLLSGPYLNPFLTLQRHRVFINKCNKVLAYHFGQKASYDLGHMAKNSYIYDILIFGLLNNQKNILRQN